jgi:PPOX class probable F420-dependent enzyme
MAGRMTPEQVRAFLMAGTRTGKLATVDASGEPHVVPVWFVLDGDDVVFTTGERSVKGRNLRRNPRVAMVVDDERPPFAFVQVRGRAELGQEGDLLHWATRIGARYMGVERAEEFGRRNAVPDELLVRIRVERVVAVTAVSE